MSIAIVISYFEKVKKVDLNFNQPYFFNL